LSKPAAILKGHTSPISQITVNNEGGYILSLSEDKVLKIWNARSLSCLQTIVDEVVHRPENIISSLLLDNVNGVIVFGSDVLDSIPVRRFLQLVAISDMKSFARIKFKLQ
jgi:WD40 repeat protein